MPQRRTGSARHHRRDIPAPRLICRLRPEGLATLRRRDALVAVQLLSKLWECRRLRDRVANQFRRAIVSKAVTSPPAATATQTSAGLDWWLEGQHVVDHGVPGVPRVRAPHCGLFFRQIGLVDYLLGAFGNADRGPFRELSIGLHARNDSQHQHHHSATEI